MKVLTILMFTVVLVAVVMADGEVEKKKVWYHAPMFKKPMQQLKECAKTLAFDGCLDKIRVKFGEGVTLLVKRYLSPKEIEELKTAE